MWLAYENEWALFSLGKRPERTDRSGIPQTPFGAAFAAKAEMTAKGE